MRGCAGVEITAISGSLDAGSSNTALLRAVAALDTDGRVVLWERLGELPHFRLDGDANDAVESLRSAVAGADLVLIATPEYAGGMPGCLKNGLDWLVGSGELYGKSVLVVSAAPSAQRGAHARQWVEHVVQMQGAQVLDSLTLAIQKNGPTSKLEDQARVLIEVLDRAIARGRSSLERRAPASDYVA